MGVFDFVSAPVADFAKNILNRFWPEKMDEADRIRAEHELTQLLQERENRLVSAQRDIIVAELQQSDRYTKRARPTIMYAGLFFVLLNYVVVPIVNRVFEWWLIAEGRPILDVYALSPMALPENFWWVWGGVCGLYVLGRSAEKGGRLFGGSKS